MKTILMLLSLISLVGCSRVRTNRTEFTLLKVGTLERLLEQGFTIDSKMPRNDSPGNQFFGGELVVIIGNETLGPIKYSGISIDIEKFPKDEFKNVHIRGNTSTAIYVGCAIVSNEKMEQKWVTKIGSDDIDHEISVSRIFDQ